MVIKILFILIAHTQVHAASLDATVQFLNSVQQAQGLMQENPWIVNL